MYLFSKKITGFCNLVCGAWLGNNKQLRFNKGEEDSLIVANREEYFKKIGIDLKNTIFQEQTHSTNIKVVSSSDRGRGAYSTKDIVKNNDALISNNKKLFLCSFTADCVPVSFFDPITHSFGIAHAGWRGTLSLIAKKTAKELNKCFGVKYSDIICYLGPFIGKCCYEVSRARDKRVQKFVSEFGSGVVIKKGVGNYLDLREAVVRQLREIGILKRNIEVSDICTFSLSFPEK